MKMVTRVESFVKALKDLIVERKTTLPILTYAVVGMNQLKSTDLDHWTLVGYDGEWQGDSIDGKREFLVPYFQLLSVLKGEKGAMTIEYLPGEAYEVAAPNTKGHKQSECGCEYRGNLSFSCGHVDSPGSKDSQESEETPETSETPETQRTVTRYGDPSVKVTVAGVEFKFPSRSMTNYPVTPEVIIGTESCHIGAQEFNTLLERTKFAISREESRYTLNGALLQVKDGRARMVATDGHRLSLADAFEAEGELTTLISAGTIEYLARRAGKLGVFITKGEEHISATMGDVTIISRKMKGNFPCYEAVMPAKFNMQLEIPSAKVADKMLLRVAQCADERSGAIRWNFNERGAFISASSTESGEAKARLDAHFTVFYAETSGDAETELPANVLSIGLSAAYVSEFLKIAGDTPVTFAMKDGQSAAVFTSGDHWKYVVMPMRV